MPASFQAQDRSRPNLHARVAATGGMWDAHASAADEEPLADGARNASSWNPRNGRDGAQRFAKHAAALVAGARARCSPSSRGRCPPPPRREATPSSSTGCWRTPWGIVSLVDLYVGFTVFSAWIWFSDPTRSSQPPDRRHDDHRLARGVRVRLEVLEEIRRRLGVVLHGELTEMTRVCGPARDVSRWSVVRRALLQTLVLRRIRRIVICLSAPGFVPRTPACCVSSRASRCVSLPWRSRGS